MDDSATPAIYPLSPRTVIRVRGADRTRFLNGQLTQDVTKAQGSHAAFTAILNAKGQLDAIAWIREHDDSYLIDAPIDLRETLLERLDRYLIADEVELSDESDQWHLTLLRGEVKAPGDILVFEIDRFGFPAHEALTPQPLDLPGVRVGGTDELEAERIANGVPGWGAELTPGMLPPEAGLDATAISYGKGCYLGQEVISRMKRAGKINRHLFRCEVAPGLDLELPCPLLADGSDAGTLTSVAPSLGNDQGSRFALGFRKRKFEEIDQLEIAQPDGTPTKQFVSHLERLAGTG